MREKLEYNKKQLQKIKKYFFITLFFNLKRKVTTNQNMKLKKNS